MNDAPRDVCAPELIRLLDHALAVADSYGAEQVGIEHILIAMLDVRNIPVRALLELGLDPTVIFARLAEITRHAVEAQALSN